MPLRRRAGPTTIARRARGPARKATGALLETAWTMTRVADIAAQTLHAHGVRHAFGMPGGEVVTLIDALQTAGIRFVLARHETAASFMAAAEGTNRGAPGLLVTTVGPGLANAVNGIADAAQEHAPLIVMSGVVDHDIRHRYTHQVLDQAALLRPLVKGSFEVEAKGAGATVARAIRLAMTPPMGPVHIDLAPGTAAKAADAGDRAASPIIKAGYDIAPGCEGLDRLAQLLAKSRRPLVVAGRGAVDDDAGEAILTLCERVSAPLITTYKAKGIIPEQHPLALGAAGLSPKADAILLPIVAEADLVLLAGYDAIEMRPGWLDPFNDGQKIVEITPHPVDHGMHRADLQMVGPVDAVLRALAAPMKCDSESVERWPVGRIAGTRDALAAAFSRSDWGPHAAIRTLQSHLDDNTIVTVDSGAHRILLSQTLKVSRPRQLQQSAGFCTMGTALPSAAGAKIARPDQTVIAVLGDGGLEMGLGELATLRDERIAITVVVFQDESLALIELKQASAGLARAGVRLGATPFERIAECYGGTGVRVSSTADFERALATARGSKAFSLIVCPFEAERYVDSL